MPVSPEFRRQVESLYHSALQIDPDKRPAFLDEACGLNSSLRQEVESLLTTHDLTKGSYSASSEVATEILGEKPGPLIGQSIAHYKILSLLGRGGMGEVYQAHDTKLGRNVALKLLPKSLHTDEERLKRFAREARSASALNHPNVCVIHEIGETEEGQSFIAMEFIQGLTLRQRLKQGPIQVNEAVNIAQQIAAALAAAHKAGVVHRDIKPENIMIRPDGYVKVLDFGLAKLTEKYTLPSDSDAATFPDFDTHSDHLIGTVNYLSPEQAKRRPVDERTDLWSLGVVLYEMLVGRMPFAGETPSHAIVAILESEPESLTKSLDGVPATLERIVRKALKKDRSERYATAGEFASDLDTVKQELATGSFATAKPERKKNESYFAMTVAVVLLLVVAGGVIYYLVHNRAPEAASSGINSLAVLPFENVNNDPNIEYLSDGLTESLINSLSQLPHVKVIGRSSSFRYKGLHTDARTAGKDLEVQAVLTGRIVEVNGDLTISVDLEDARDNRHIWGERFHRKTGEIFLVQEDISKIISEKLSLRINPAEQQRIAKRYTDNVQAYQYYLKGRWFWNQRTPDGMRQAADFYKQAIDLDPNYALAYAGLADVYVLNGANPRESYLRAKEASAKALEIDDTLGEAHATLGFIKSHYEWDWNGGEAEFRRAIELNPNYATAHHWYGDHLIARGKLDAASQELKKAAELEPLSPVVNTEFGLIYFYSRDYDRAIEYFKKMEFLFPDFFPAHLYLGWTYTQKKMYQEALSEYQQAGTLSKGNNIALAVSGYTYGVSGNGPAARKVLKDLEKRTERVPPLRFALVYTGLGEKNKAFEWLNRGYDERDIMLLYANVNPFFDTLRSDARFGELIRKLNLAM